MNRPQFLQDFTIIQTLGDPRRLEILRRLMAQNATISQLGAVMGLHPAKVRYHLKQLEATNLVTLTESREVRGFVEKYYAATAQAFFVNQVVLPQMDQAGTVVFLGSHDPAMELLAAHLDQEKTPTKLLAIPVGSLDGLIALRQGFCQLTGCHLYDAPSGEYNAPYVRHFFPGESMYLVTLAHRLQGLLVSPGNPKRIQGIQDLTRDDLMMVNRKGGSGTRLWLDQQLKSLNVDKTMVRGYQVQLNTHSQVAEAVLGGKADVGLAVFAAAKRFQLDFIPLFEERFDLVIPAEEYYRKKLIPVLDQIHSAQFRNDLRQLGGYDSHETGKEAILH